MTETALRFRVCGRVQGVWFRAWTRDEALARGLRGWVRNEPDGSVSGLLAGPAAAIEAMVRALHDGPPAAKVSQVETTPADPAEAPAGFEIRR